MYEILITTPLGDTKNTIPEDNGELWNTLQGCIELDFETSVGRVQSREKLGDKTIRLHYLWRAP